MAQEIPNTGTYMHFKLNVYTFGIYAHIYKTQLNLMWTKTRLLLSEQYD